MLRNAGRIHQIVSAWNVREVLLAVEPLQYLRDLLLLAVDQRLSLSMHSLLLLVSASGNELCEGDIGSRALHDAVRRRQSTPVLALLF